MDVDKFISDILADLKTGHLHLPTLPQVALKINDIIVDPNATAKAVAKVVGADPALSARLIQAANSPLARANHKVENVQTAVTRLGMLTVRNLVSSFLIRNMFHTRYPALKQRMLSLWNHSAQVAAISFVLANKYTELKPDEAMLAGLIHDIGKLPIIAKAEEYPGLVKNPASLDVVLDKLHARLGKVIVQAWRFAPEFVTAVAEHENLQYEGEGIDLVDVVTVANLHSYAGKDHPLGRLNWAEVPAFKKLELDPEASIAALEEARQEIQQIFQLLS